MPSKEFIQRLNRKQFDAYEELFQTFYRYLVVFAHRYVLQQELAEDIVQEVIINIWESDKEFNSEHGFRIFLYNAVRNSCINYLKREEIKTRYQQYILQETKEFEEEENYQLIREEMYRILHETIERLPQRCKAVFELRLQGKKNEEIAHLLQISIETVKTQNKKALHFLRHELKDIFQLLVALKII